VEEVDAKGKRNDDDELERVRRKRVAELKDLRARSQFGSVKDITGAEFSPEVIEASRQSPPGTTSSSSSGISVVLLLYRTSSSCSIMLDIITTLAQRHPTVKFCRLDVVRWPVERFPLEHCPTLMCYRGGEKLAQLVTLAAFAGSQTTTDVVEWDLSLLGILQSQLSDDPRHVKPKSSSTSTTSTSSHHTSTSGGGAAASVRTSDMATAVADRRKNFIVAQKELNSDEDDSD
jgi:hypothetical protein